MRERPRPTGLPRRRARYLSHPKRTDREQQHRHAVALPCGQGVLGIVLEVARRGCDRREGGRLRVAYARYLWRRWSPLEAQVAACEERRRSEVHALQSKREQEEADEAKRPKAARKTGSRRNLSGGSGSNGLRRALPSGHDREKKKTSSGIASVKMPAKVTESIDDPDITFIQMCELGDEKALEFVAMATPEDEFENVSRSSSSSPRNSSTKATSTTVTMTQSRTDQWTHAVRIRVRGPKSRALRVNARTGRSLKRAKRLSLI